MTWEVAVGLLGTLLAGVLGGGAAVVKYMNRHVDRARAKLDDAKAKVEDVAALRDIIAEARAERAEDKAEKAELRAQMTELRGRIDQLEERERHQLTRAAVHEAWDQLAFQALLAMNPQHPPPPPLAPPGDRVDPPSEPV